VLVRNRGELVPRSRLLREVRGPACEDRTNYLRVHMAHIRRKLEPETRNPRYFLTEPGMGHRFQSNGAERG
jgi:two-component system, OmpR family, KDP operon response regulator KdpE